MQPPTPDRTPVAEATIDDFASDRYSDGIISLVADYTGRDALELPTLFDAIHTDALDRLLEETTDITVTFTYAEHEVVCGDGSIQLFPTAVTDAGDRSAGHSSAE